MEKKRIPLIRKYQASFESFVTHTASPQTAKRYSKALEAFFSYFPEKGEPGDWSKMDVQDYRAYRRKKKISARTVNYEIQVVRRFWKWMIDSEVATFNPTNAIKSLREADVARWSLGEDEQEKLYAVCMNDQERLLVGLALTTGLRTATLRQLEKSDFNIPEKMVVIGPEKMKTQSSHELPIRDEELALIAQLPEGNIWGAWGTARALEYRWNKLCQRAGIALRGLRTARRTTATTLLRNGVDVSLVKDWLAHKNIKTTARYVTPATRRELKEALRFMPGIQHNKQTFDGGINGNTD